MDSFVKRKYKDEVPILTIKKIKNILTDLGILSIETGWQNSAEDFFSVNLKIAETKIATNGKGTTNAFALASGYGELMERLQNQSFFRLNADMRFEALEYKGFYYAPDEKLCSIDELLNSEEEWISKQFRKAKPNIDRRELLKEWKRVSYEDTPADFIALPYINLLTSKISNIPIKMISKMYMSNGMCGGNTYEEALVQGLSEIFERYVNKEIIRNKITPPTIPLYYLEKFPRIISMISQIKASGNYEVIVKDCSLGEDFPVVGVIFINKEEQSYFIKFGSHPVVEIAIERTLTELLQGQDIKRMMGVKEYKYKIEIEDENSNIIGILVNGSGYYPSEIFSPNYSYNFKEITNYESASNKELLKAYIEFLKNKNLDCFVRDVSFLGFPSFHIIIPGLSEIDEFDDLKVVAEYGKFNQIKRYIRNLEAITDKDMEEILNFFSDIKYSSQASIPDFLNLPVKNIFPWYYVSIDLFITALHLKRKDYVKAHEAISRYVDNITNMPYRPMEKMFYKCARDYIGTQIDKMEIEDAIDHLEVFYPLPVIQGVITDFGQSSDVFNTYGQLQCFNCENCKLKNQCFYLETEKVYRILKEKYAENIIKQSDLTNKLNL